MLFAQLFLNLLTAACSVIFFLIGVRLFKSTRDQYDWELTRAGRRLARKLPVGSDSYKEIGSFASYKKFWEMKLSDLFVFRKDHPHSDWIQWWYCFAIFTLTFINPQLGAFLSIGGIIAYYDQLYASAPIIFTILGAVIWFWKLFLNGQLFVHTHGLAINPYVIGLIIWPTILYIISLVMGYFWNWPWLLDIEYLFLVALMVKLPILSVLLFFVPTSVIILLHRNSAWFRSFFDRYFLVVEKEIKESGKMVRAHLHPATPIIFFWIVLFILVFWLNGAQALDSYMLSKIAHAYYNWLSLII